MDVEPRHTTADPLAESALLLLEFGKSLGTVLDLEDLLTKVLDAAIMLTRTSEGSIYLVSPDNGKLTRQANSPTDLNGKPHLDRGLSELVASVVASQRIHIMLEAGDYLPLPDSSQQVDSNLLYVPLISKGSLVGVLGVAGDRPLTTQDYDLLTGLSGFAAVGIENARLYRQAIDQSAELGLLVESANAMSWLLDFRTVLNTISRHITRSLRVHWCIISLWDSEARTISRLAEYRRGFWTEPRAIAQDTNAWKAYRRAASGGAFAALGVDDELTSSRHCGRVLLVPLQHKGKVVGLVDLAFLQSTDPFTSTEIQRALRNAPPLAAILASAIDLSNEAEMLNITRTIVSATGANWCTVLRCSDDSDKFERVLDYGTGEWVERTGPHVDITELPTPRVVLTEQRTAVLRSDDKGLSASERRLFEPVGDGSLLLLPLVFKAKTVGLVQLYDIQKEREFSAREMGLAHALANQAAIAVENASLVHDLQRSLEQQQAMQSQLVRAARLSAVGEMAMVIAHQINNPLTTILGDAEIMVQDTPPGSPLHESADAIRRAGQRAKRVVERILTMGRQDAEPTIIDLNMTVRDTLDLIGAQVSYAQIEVELQLAPSNPKVHAAPGNLEDVWMNLIINARDSIVEAKRSNGKITVTTGLETRHGTVKVSVDDNGCGIDAESLSRLFDPLFTTKPPGKGTGLGLYICQQIVTTNNGRIAVSSQPGKGTRVTVSLPTVVSPDRTG